MRVACPEGLSPTDEFYLWGLLSLTFSQPPAHRRFLRHALLLPSPTRLR